MRYSLAKHSLAISLATACAHSPGVIQQESAIDPVANYKFARYTSLSLSELHKLEYKKPFDDSVKWAIGRLQYCSGQLAFAYENWMTIARYSNDSEFIQRSRTLLRDAKKDHEKVFESLECPPQAG
jgi:hypothetical protein